ncbi:DUF3108 domain-containing protein [Alsobacter sp. R-9]
MAKDTGRGPDSRRTWRRGAIAVVAGAVFAAGAARADQIDISYDLSLAGLPIGTATLGGTVNRDNYKIDVRAKMTGLAGMITGGRGAGSSSGGTAGGRPVPSSYALVSTGSNGTYSVRMALASGTVAALEIKPPLDEKIDRVPLQDQHKRNVVDPVSALLMPVARSGPLLDPASCNRTIPVFDGAGRFDVELTYASRETIDIPGYKGPVIVCAARYTPIAGHRTNRKSTQFMADNRDMETWLAPVDNARMLVPVKISVKTMVGTTVIEANKFSTTRSTASTTAPDAGRSAPAGAN